MSCRSVASIVTLQSIVSSFRAIYDMRLFRDGVAEWEQTVDRLGADMQILSVTESVPVPSFPYEMPNFQSDNSEPGYTSHLQWEPFLDIIGFSDVHEDAVKSYVTQQLHALCKLSRKDAPQGSIQTLIKVKQGTLGDHYSYAFNGQMYAKLGPHAGDKSYDEEVLPLATRMGLDHQSHMLFTWAATAPGMAVSPREGLTVDQLRGFCTPVLGEDLTRYGGQLQAFESAFHAYWTEVGLSAPKIRLETTSRWIFGEPAWLLCSVEHSREQEQSTPVAWSDSATDAAGSLSWPETPESSAATEEHAAGSASKASGQGKGKKRLQRPTGIH